ncbi:hypothetical protein C8Q80DRAFT_361207 [Daedaleopsis nitida]|nr:hypothetical protein C8Q80DRAFT_361207 [Daedaleopsis nitida]
MSSSDDDAAIWQSIGYDIIHSFVAVTVETFVIAIYTVMVIKTGILLLRKNRTRVSVSTLAAVLVMFGLALALWIIDIHNVVAEVQMTLLKEPIGQPESLSDVYSAAVTAVLRLASVEDILYSYMTIIGDGIIIWRVYAFWSNGQEKLALLIPLAFLLGSIAVSMMLTYCSARLGSDIVRGSYLHPAFCRNIQTASYSTTLATTAVATMLISYKTWEYRHVHMEAFGKTSSSRTQRIMFMLIESGILYMLFFLVQVIDSTQVVSDSISRSKGLSFASTVYEFITSLIVGMYPTAVILLVNSKYSVLQTSSVTSSSGTAHSAGQYKTSHGMSQNTLAHVHTTSSATTAPARGAATTVDLYEMARLASTDGAEESDIKDGGNLGVRVKQPGDYHV